MTLKRLPAAVGRLAFLLLFTRCGPLPPDGMDQAGDAPGESYALGLGGPCWADDVTVRNFGQVVFEGDMDLTSEVWRITHGEHLPFRHDGTVFRNREHRLPARPAAYYHEWVHLTPGIRGPGPQRLVIGADGDVNYTPDHYATFVVLDAACILTTTPGRTGCSDDGVPRAHHACATAMFEARGMLETLGMSRKSEWLPRPDSNQ